MKLTKTQKVVITFAHDTTAGELYNALEEVPCSAKITVDHYKGDQREPSYTTMTCTWSD